MGKRRKAIRWLVAIVIVALIGGVTAVAVDRRIREQVEEEYLDRVMEMVNLNGWYRKALSITGEAKYSWDGIEFHYSPQIFCTIPAIHHHQYPCRKFHLPNL